MEKERRFFGAVTPITRMLSCLLALTLVACGGGAGGLRPDTGSSQTISTGVLLDAPVAGVSYTTPTRSGVTNGAGEFTYLAGETVSFALGDLELGRVAGQPIVDLFELGGIAEKPATTKELQALLLTETDLPPPVNRTLNLAVLLQSLDEDNDPENGIVIAPAVAELIEAQELQLDSFWYDFPYGGNLFDGRGLIGLLGRAAAADLMAPRFVSPAGAALAHLFDSLEISIPVWRSTRSMRDTDNDGTPDWERFLRYNAEGNVDLDRYDQNGDGVIDLVSSYTYEDHPGWSRVEQDNDADGVIDRIRTLTYDDYGRIIEDRTLDNGNLSALRVMVYDADGRLIRRENGVPPNTVVEVWQVDETGLRSINDVDTNGDGVFEQRRFLSFAGVQRSNLWTLQEIDIGLDGTIDQRIERAHDSLGRLISETIDRDLDGTPESASRYTFDEFGLVQSESTIGTTTITYRVTRDSTGRVLSEQEDRNGNPTYRQQFTYDESGREIQRTDDYDGDGEIDRITTRFYDEGGNEIRRESDNNADGAADRISTFVYDALGRQTETLVDSNADGTIDERYVDSDWVDVGVEGLF